MRAPLYLAVTLVTCVTGVLSAGRAIKYVRVSDYENLLYNRPPRQPEPITNDAIKSLPLFKQVRVGIFHFEFTPGDKNEVPEVQPELNGVRTLFESYYHFDVRDFSIPKSTSTEATSYVVQQVGSLYGGLSGPDSLVIIVYGGHGDRGGTWSINTVDRGAIFIDWRMIDTTVIAPTGVHTFQIIDSCHAAGFLPTLGESYPAEWEGRGTFSVIAAASALTEASVCANAFTKAVLFTLKVPDHGEPHEFIPSSLYNALPVVDQTYAYLNTGKADDLEASLKSWNAHRFYELAQADETSYPRKIAPLGCS